MLRGQPYARAIARYLIVIYACACAAACGGGTTVTEIGGPEIVRCQVSLGADTRTVPADGGSVTVTVDATRDCTWTASTEAGWAALSTTTGQGAGTIGVTIAASQQGAVRTASIVVNNQRLDIAQEARPCRFTFDPSSVEAGPAGGAVTVAVATLAGCTWRATTSAGWIAVPSASRSGPGTIEIDLASNPGPQRTGVVTIGDQTLRVTQAAAGMPAPVPPACTPVVQPASLDVPAAAATEMIRIEVAASCPWTAASGLPWLTIASAAAGQGAATVRVAIAQNTGAARTGTVTVAGQAITIRQAAPTPTPPPCTFAIDPVERSFPSDGGEGRVTVATREGCSWSAATAAPWLTVTVAAGTGSGEARYRVQANGGTEPRSATVTIAGRAHRVTQSGVAPPCTFAIDPAAASVPAAGGERRFSVSTMPGCAWSASSGAEWVTITSGSGTESGEVIYVVQPNPAASPRTTTIAAGGQSHTIVQAAAAPTCTYAVDPPSQQVAAAGGETRFSVITQAGCGWTASTGAMWLAFSNTTGSGPGQVIFTAQPNGATEPRSAVIAVGGQSHTVTQAAAAPACTYAIAPASYAMPAAGGENRFTVTTQPTCAWSAAPSAEWLSVATGSGTGTAEIVYTAQPNTATEPRSASIVVNGQVHAVVQAAAAPVCTYSLAPASFAAAAAGGEGRFTVTTQAGCTWSASTVATWVTLTTASGSGPGDVVYTVQPNSSTEGRSATIDAGGQTHTVTQAGAATPPPPPPPPPPAPSP